MMREGAAVCRPKVNTIETQRGMGEERKEKKGSSSSSSSRRAAERDTEERRETEVMSGMKGEATDEATIAAGGNISAKKIWRGRKGAGKKKSEWGRKDAKRSKRESGNVKSDIEERQSESRGCEEECLEAEEGEGKLG